MVGETSKRKSSPRTKSYAPTHEHLLTVLRQEITTTEGRLVEDRAKLKKMVFVLWEMEGHVHTSVRNSLLSKGDDDEEPEEEAERSLESNNSKD